MQRSQSNAMRNSDPVAAPAAAEVAAPLFTMEIGPDKYLHRERYAVRDVIHARAPLGIERVLRELTRNADGRTIYAHLGYK